jgi:hypothetical protein
MSKIHVCCLFFTPVPRITLNPKLRKCLHSSPLLTSNLRQINLVYTLLSYIVKVYYFNIVTYLGSVA